MRKPSYVWLIHWLIQLILEDSPMQKESQQESKFGFTAVAETWNGRLAMLGFVIGLATELLTGQGILSQLGLM